MGEKTTIEWTDSTWNPLRGTIGKWSCVKVSPGCQFCYAERVNRRFGGPDYRVGADTVRLDERALTEPLRWKLPRRVFVCSMSDLFGEWVPDEWLHRIFAVMALAGGHTYQVLTKRAERMRDYLADPATPGNVAAAVERQMQREPRLTGRTWRDFVGYRVPWPLPNVWVGVSVEDQQRADERIPHLIETPAAVRFLSMEPLLGPVNLDPWLWEEAGPAWAGRNPSPDIDWVIVGGESGGPNARRLVGTCSVREPSGDPCRVCHGSGWSATADGLVWVRSIRDQCVHALCPFLFKQWGGPTPKSGGRELDGRTWDEYPEVPA